MQRERRCLGKRRALLAGRIGQFVPPQRREVHADAAEHAERAVESVAGVALLEQGGYENQPLVAQRSLDRIATTGHLAALGAREVKLLEFRVHLDE